MAKDKYNSPEHRRRRRDYKAAIASGQGWCVEPVCVMPSRYIEPGSAWDVPHNEDGITYRDGPAHSRCNRADGGRRRHDPTVVATATRASRPGGTFAKRECVICSAIYTPSYSKQASCGRACGQIMKDRGIKPAVIYAKVHKQCVECGIHFPHDGTPRKFCETCRPGSRTPAATPSRWAL